jgi:hypothetical protein
MKKLDDKLIPLTASTFVPAGQAVEIAPVPDIPATVGVTLPVLPEPSARLTMTFEGVPAIVKQ